MKRFLFPLLVIVLITSCQKQTSQENTNIVVEITQNTGDNGKWWGDLVDRNWQ